jgi:hypothetical protein
MPQLLLLSSLIVLSFVLNRKDLKNYKIWTLQSFGYICLFSFMLFMKHIVFEWLEWNGTTKNDWFYIMWWGLILLWSIFGVSIIKMRIRRR